MTYLIELDPHADGDDLEFDGCRCTVCADVVGPHLRENADGGYEHGAWAETWMDGGLRLYCEGCADDLENLTLTEWVRTFHGGPVEDENAAGYWHDARLPQIADLTYLRLAPGVDYDVATCPVCGESTDHDHTADEYRDALGEFDHDPDQPRGPL